MKLELDLEVGIGFGQVEGSGESSPGRNIGSEITTAGRSNWST